MAVTIGASPLVDTVHSLLAALGKQRAIKSFLLNPAISDADVITLFTALDHVTNAAFVKASINGRAILGLNAAPTNAIYNLLQVEAVWTFTRVNPVNAAKIITKDFLIPAPVQALFDVDNKIDVGTPGTDSVSDYAAAAIAILEDNLAFLGADGVYYSGGFTFSPAESGLVTASAVIS